MIKLLVFVSRRDEVDAERFGAEWERAVASVHAAPASARPVRVAACRVLHDVDGTSGDHDGVALWWFTDAEHLARFDAWRATPDGELLRDVIHRVVDPARTRAVVADEEIGRGADWLERRWTDGDVKFKHMAIAFRADGLTQRQFSELWRARSGKVGRPGAGAVTIPDDARGMAYVQNHPRPRPEGEWAYDAVNEVYFDDLAGLRTRVDWFAEHLAGSAEDDLVGDHAFLVVREVPMAAAGSPPAQPE